MLSSESGPVDQFAERLQSLTARKADLDRELLQITNELHVRGGTKANQSTLGPFYFEALAQLSIDQLTHLDLVAVTRTHA